MSGFIKVIPDDVDIGPCLVDTPLSQILFLADHFANAQDYAPALKLYQLALSREKANSKRLEGPRDAIAKIEQIINENKTLNPQQEIFE